jgi:hypothetical protein
MALEDKETLKKMLTEPPVKKIDLHFPLGLEVSARNLRGVTIKDALDAIHKQYRKKVSQTVHCILRSLCSSNIEDHSQPFILSNFSFFHTLKLYMKLNSQD